MHVLEVEVTVFEDNCKLFCAAMARDSCKMVRWDSVILYITNFLFN